jgi:hypothetical protein
MQVDNDAITFKVEYSHSKEQRNGLGSEVPQVVREVGMFAVILKAVPNYDKQS